MRYSDEVKCKIIDGIKNRVPLNEIYSDVSDSFKTKPEFVRYTNAITTDSISKEEMEQYFLDIYIQKYNAELAWGSLGFGFFWRTYGFGCMDNSWNFCDLIHCAKKALNYLYENYLYIPRCFSDIAVKAVAEGVRIPVEAYGYPLRNSYVANCGQYLEYLLPQNFSDEEIKEYVSKQIFPDIIKHPKTKRKLLAELFGVAETSLTACYPNLNRAVENAMGLYRHCPVRPKEWEENTERRTEWYGYSEQEIDLQLQKLRSYFFEIENHLLEAEYLKSFMAYQVEILKISMNHFLFSIQKANTYWRELMK